MAHLFWCYILSSAANKNLLIACAPLRNSAGDRLWGIGATNKTGYAVNETPLRCQLGFWVGPETDIKWPLIAKESNLLQCVYWPTNVLRPSFILQRSEIEFIQNIDKVSWVSKNYWNHIFRIINDDPAVYVQVRQFLWIFENNTWWCPPKWAICLLRRVCICLRPWYHRIFLWRVWDYLKGGNT